MKILLTGSTGYIGRRLLPTLVEAGHHVVCLVRDQRKFDWEDFSPDFLKNVDVIEADLNDLTTCNTIPADVDAAYYLVHAMSSSSKNFADLETESAQNFVLLVERTQAQQIIYLGGITNDNNLSEHLSSRKNVEGILKQSRVPTTVLKAAIIIGSGSASFEIIRDLVEKLPVMIAPKWINTKCQPIGIRNVIEYLHGVLANTETYDREFDIGGTDVLSYKDMLHGFANIRGLKRWIIIVPVLTPKLSSWWLILVTSATYSLAKNLVKSMHNEVVCNDERIRDYVPTKILTYSESLTLAFDRISQKNVVSNWRDSLALSRLDKKVLETMQAPEYGVLTDKRQLEFKRNRDEVLKNIWSIGGVRGWYTANWMWRTRGAIDRLVGGVGLRRNSQRFENLKSGDAIDFWRVLVADKKNGRLLLYAEMKLPGEAWLEFKVQQQEGKQTLIQTATFRPLGLWGRLYWYLVLPFHGFIFPKMAWHIVNRKE